MADEVDLLKIKIETAKADLPEATRKAIDAVDWKAAILGLRESKGYSFEQLGDLETETELVLNGLLRPEDYPHELEKRMNIPKSKADELVNEMNQLVFAPIREEIVKNAAREKAFAPRPATTPAMEIKTKPTFMPNPPAVKENEAAILHSAGIKIIDPTQPTAVAPVQVAPINPSARPDLSVPELKAPAPSILTQKLGGSFKIDTTKTEHAINTPSTKQNSPNISGIKVYPKGQDPYRIAPDQ